MRQVEIIQEDRASSLIGPPARKARGLSFTVPVKQEWIERMARLGYATRGIVYMLLGGIAAQAALSLRNNAPELEDVLTLIFMRPFGRFMLAAVVVGLAGFALWRFFQALVDPERLCLGLKGAGYRAFYVVSGLIHASLALTGVRLLVDGQAGSGRGLQDWTAQLVPQPFGRWFVALCGAVVFGCGLWQLYQAYTARFKRKLKLAEMSSVEDLCALPVSRFGILARGVVFCELGALIIAGAISGEPDKVRGIGQALKTIEQMRYGLVLVTVLAAGLIAYGLYNLIEARYRLIISSRLRLR